MRFFIAFLICICAIVLFGVHVPGATAAQGGITPAAPKKALTNQDVVQMVRAKFADSMIVKAIEAKQTGIAWQTQGRWRSKLYLQTISPDLLKA
jgi:hypothetical protein